MAGKVEATIFSQYLGRSMKAIPSVEAKITSEIRGASQGLTFASDQTGLLIHISDEAQKNMADIRTKNNIIPFFCICLYYINYS